MTKRILVADTPEGDRRISAILAGYDLVFVRTFDDSRMFDLLRYVQAVGGPPGCAVICMRSQHFHSPAITIEGLEIAAKALGCNLFLDLTWYADDATGNAAVRMMLEALLNP